MKYTYTVFTRQKDRHTFPPDSHLKGGGCSDLSRRRLPPVNHSTLAYVCHYPGADCHQLSTIPPWPMCVTIQGQTTTSHQPFHPGLCVSLSRWRLPPVINHSTLAYVSLSRGRLPPVINHSTLAYVYVSLSRGRLPPVINHSTLAYVYVSLSRGRLPPVINHSTLAYVCHYLEADCYQSSTIPPWPMCVTIQVETATSHQPFHPGLCVCVTIQGQTATSYQPFHPGLCVCVTIQGQTATSHQPFQPGLCVCVTIQGQTATSHQPFHPSLCVSLSRGRLPSVINHSTLAYVCHYTCIAPLNRLTSCLRISEAGGSRRKCPRCAECV